MTTLSDFIKRAQGGGFKLPVKPVTPTPVYGPPTQQQSTAYLQQAKQNIASSTKKTTVTTPVVTTTKTTTPVVTTTKTNETKTTFTPPPGLVGQIVISPEAKDITPTYVAPDAKTIGVQTGGTSTVAQLIGGGGTTQKTIQTPGGSLEVTKIAEHPVISGGTSVQAPSGKVVGGSYEAGAGSGGGRTTPVSIEPKPEVIDVGWGTRIPVADTQAQHDYNPYQQDQSQRTEYDKTITDLESQRTETVDYINDLNTSKQTINQSLQTIQGSDQKSTWDITYYDEEKGKQVTMNDVAQQDAIRFYQDRLKKTDTYYSDAVAQRNDLNKNIAVISGYKDAGYTIKTTDQGYSFGTPKASDVVRYVYGGERPDIYTASAMGSMGLGFIGAGIQQLITGEPSLESWKEQTAETILGTTRQKGESIEAYTARFWTSPKVLTEIYLPIATLGAGALLTEGAGLARAGLTGLTSRVPTSVSEFFAPITERVAIVGKAVSPYAEYIGKSKIIQAEIKYGMFAGMEGPGLIETAREHPERLGSLLGSSLYSWELSWVTMTKGAEIGIPSGEQAYYQTIRPGTLPKETNIFFGEGRTERIDIYEPYPEAKILTEKPPGIVTIIEEYPKRGRPELIEAGKPRGGLEIPASYEQEVTRVGRGAEEELVSIRTQGGENIASISRQRITGNTLDIIEAKRGAPAGKPLIEEPKKGRLEITDFAPKEGYTIEGFTGVKRITPVSKYGLGTQEPSLMETMPLTKEQAIKSQKAIYSSRDIGKIPATQEEALARIQSYYGEPVKAEGTIALKIKGETKLFTKEDIADFTGLSKPEPITKQGIFNLDYKAEENIFYKELAEGKPLEPDIYTGIKKEAAGVKIRGKTKVFTGEQLRELGKGELKTLPQRYTREQLQKAIYKPGGLAEYTGKRGRYALRVIEEKPVGIEVRPKEGWGEYLKGREPGTWGYTGRKGEYRFPEFEKEPVKPSGQSTPLKFERPGEPASKIKPGEEIKPVTSGDMELVSVKKTEATKPGLKTDLVEETRTSVTETTRRPLTREELYILGSQQETEIISPRWEGVRPKMTGARLLSRTTEKGLLSRVGKGTLLGTITGGELGTTPSYEETILSAPKTRTETELIYKGDILTETRTGFMPETKTDVFMRERQAERQESRITQLMRQELGSLQEQMQEQRLMTIQPLMTQTISETELIERPTIRQRPPEEKTRIEPIFIPPRKTEKKEPSRQLIEKPREGEAYDVYVKERGMYYGKIRKGFKFAKVNKKPLTETDALALGGEITDNTSAVSFRLKKTRGRPERPDRSIRAFSERQHKFTKKGETYIEKPEYRMDTPGELSGISALGHEERRRQGRQTKPLYQPVLRTPRNKNTGLLSTKNNNTGLLSSPTRKLKENFIFRKKKGGKNNDYY